MKESFYYLIRIELLMDYKTMNKRFRIRRPNHHCTSYIQLNTRNCRSCWKCLEKCPNKVIGKVDFLGHSHALIKKPDQCSGCLACVKVCVFDACKPLNEF